MREPSTAISYYEAIHEASRIRLEAARRADWTRLYDMDEHCAALIGELAAAGARKRLTPAERKRRLEILHSIIEEDAEVRAILYPSLARLQAQLAEPRRASAGHGHDERRQAARTPSGARGPRPA